MGDVQIATNTIKQVQKEPVPTIRPPNQSELDLMQKTLDEFKGHFKEFWSDSEYYGGYYELLGFCYYEGCGGDCCGDILGRAAPYALGYELVKRYNFQWAIEEDGQSSKTGVTHARLSFLDLFDLEDKHLIMPEDRLADYETYERGQATCDSLRGILELVGEKHRRDM